MAREPYTVNEVKAKIRNAVRNGLKNTAYYKDLQEQLFQAARRELKKDSISMKPSGEDEYYPDMITGTLRKTNSAKKEFLAHTYSNADLNAARYIWNHPEKMRYVGNSPLGADKDKTFIDDRKNIERKKREGVVSFSRYYFEFAGRTWLVKTARNKDGYETFYHIRKV